MSKQTSLDRFFKSRGSLSMENKNKYKRRNLSLTRSYSYKSPKKENELKDEVVIISLLSSSEECLTPPDEPTYPSTSKNVVNIARPDTTDGITSPNGSTNSSETIVYNLTPNTLQTNRTPSKTSKSPKSAGKYYSPTKKRLVTKRSVIKKKLHFTEDSNQENFTTQITKSYQDDKTQFLCSIINEYLNNNALKHLLELPSQELLSRCVYIQEPGMRVVCRLFWRQPVWYRIEELTQIATDKNKYVVPNIPELLKSLIDNNLIIDAQCRDHSSMNFDDYVKLLKKPELDKICKELKLKIKSKEDAVNALKKFSQCTNISNYFTGKIVNNSDRVLKILKAATGQCYRLSDTAYTTICNLYVLMYLGMDYTIIREKRLELVLLHDKLKKEPYPIDKNMLLDNASVVFQSGEEFYRYLEAHTMYEKYLMLSDTQEKCMIIMKTFNLYKDISEEHLLRYKSLQPWLRRFTPAYIYVKILEGGIQELKKVKVESHYLLAVEILDSLIGQLAFRQHKKAEWYAEKSLILHKYLKCSEQAAQTLLKGFNAKCLSEETKDAMRPRAKLIANQCNIVLNEDLRRDLKYYTEQGYILESNLPADHIDKQPMDNHKQKGKLKFELHTEDGKSILTAEDYCAYYYVNKGEFQRGEHWEGRMMTTIFFLLFWDIIYTKPVGITGIFLSYYQRHPLDMYSENFYVNRKTLIDDRLIFIEECTEDLIIDMMQSRWEERPESELSDINRNIPWEDVVSVVRCLGLRPLAAICRRFATNYGYTHSGFPDLTLWDDHAKKIKFVEVKTDADKPSMKQLQWLEYLRSHNIEAGFCYVGANTTRCKARQRNSTSL